MGSKIIHISGESELNSYISQSASKNKLVVIDFTATWCGPCQRIAPFFEQLSVQYDNAFFLKVDIDENQDIAVGSGVKGVPAFHFYSKGAKVDEVVGANPNQLEACVKKHYTAGSFQGQGRTIGSSSSQPPSTQESPKPSPSTTFSGPDPSQPITSIQFRFPDGSRLIGQFNLTSTVGDIRAFISSSKPGIKASFQLMTSFPPQPLSDISKSISDASLQNAVVSVKL